jgi:DNA-binding GntR family transcriptional regulator
MIGTTPVTESFRSKKELAKEQVLDAIRTGRYRPGDRLRQNQIARDLGLSSTPVREALSELQSNGVLVHETHRGVRVASLDAARVRQVYQARTAIERETARLAFPRIDAAVVRRLKKLLGQMRRDQRAGRMEALSAADEAFHLAMFEASGNPYLMAAIRALWDSFPRYLIWRLEGRLARSADEHERMVATLEGGDAAAFLDAVEAHLDNSLAAILDDLAEKAGAAPDARQME